MRKNESKILLMTILPPLMVNDTIIIQPFRLWSFRDFQANLFYSALKLNQRHHYLYWQRSELNESLGYIPGL